MSTQKNLGRIRLQPRGVYDPTVDDYRQLDVVSHKARVWIATQDNIQTGTEPGTDEGVDAWEVMADLDEATVAAMQSKLNLAETIHELSTFSSASDYYKPTGWSGFLDKSSVGLPEGQSNYLHYNVLSVRDFDKSVFAIGTFRGGNSVYWTEMPSGSSRTEDYEMPIWQKFLSATNSGSVLGIVNVVEYGADPTGETDSWEAIQSCVDDFAGQAIVFIPEGTFTISREIKQPTHSWIKGAGKDSTLVKLGFGHTGDQNVFTNSENTRGSDNAGNQFIVLEDISCHTNFENSSDQNNGKSTSACGVGYANVQYARISRVRVIEAKGNHCIDIEGSMYSRSGGTTTLDYGQDPADAGFDRIDNGDGTYTSTDGACTNDVTYQPGFSKYVLIEDCDVSDWGDDGITTHNSEYLWINRCTGKQTDPTTGGNSNFVEIDDGSRNVWVNDVRGENCKIAVGVKAHYNSPAPYNVHIKAIHSVNCRIGFRCYHTDHMSSDLESPTGRNIAVDGVFYSRPLSPDNDGSRAVMIQSYEGVNVVGVYADGRGSTPGYVEDMIQISGWGRACHFSGINVNDWVLKDGSAVFRGSDTTGYGNSVEKVHAVRVNGNGIVHTGSAQGFSIRAVALVGTNDSQQYEGIVCTGGDRNVAVEGANHVVGYTTLIDP